MQKPTRPRGSLNRINVCQIKSYRAVQTPGFCTEQVSGLPHSAKLKHDTSGKALQNKTKCLFPSHDGDDTDNFPIWINS